MESLHPKLIKKILRSIAKESILRAEKQEAQVLGLDEELEGGTYNVEQPPEGFKPPFLMVVVDGNIGSGKTTFLTACEKLMSAQQIIISKENVDAFHEELKAFYGDRSPKNAVALENAVLDETCRRFNTVMRGDLSEKIVVFERFFESVSMFVSVNAGTYGATKEESNAEELKLLKRAARNMKKARKILGSNPLNCYLMVGAQSCLERIKKRDRDGEEFITLEYLQKLENRHSEFFSTRPYVCGFDDPWEKVIAECSRFTIPGIMLSTDKTDEEGTPEIPSEALMEFLERVIWFRQLCSLVKQLLRFR